MLEAINGGPPLLVLDGIETFYGAIQALKGVSFKVPQGSIVTLLGANGAGKSTLLSIAATLLEPTHGRVLYGDQPATEEVRGRIGLLAHDLYIYPELTAAENLSFFARLHGLPSPEDFETLLDTLAQRFGWSARPSVAGAVA